MGQGRYLRVNSLEGEEVVIRKRDIRIVAPDTDGLVKILLDGGDVVTTTQSIKEIYDMLQ